MAPALLASIGVMVAALLLGRQFAIGGYSALRLAGVTAYVVGAVAAGALVVGHEYGHRTVGWLLMQPISRRTLVLAKVAALGVALVVMVTAGAVFLATASSLDVRVWSVAGRWSVSTSAHTVTTPWTLLLLPLLCGAFVAPWLTMVFRNVLAGIVFTIFVPMFVWLVADAAISFRFKASGYAPEEARLLSEQIVWYWSLGLCAAGAVLGWRRFMQLEARDEPTAGLSLEGLADRATDTGMTRASSPLGALLRKECRVHQMAFVLAGLYAALYVVLQLTVPVGRDFVANMTTLLLAIYAGLMTLLIGASSVAEERRLGTLEWQLLLPVAARRQWAVKVAVVAAVGIGLVGGVPWLMTTVVPPVESIGRIRWYPVAVLAVGLACGTYVSSWTRDGLRALLTSGLVVAGAMSVLALLVSIEWNLTSALLPSFEAMAGRLFPEGLDRAAARNLDSGFEGMKIVIVALGAGLLLRLGARNFRVSQVSRRAVGRQLAWLAGMEVIGVVLFIVIAAARMATFDQTKWVIQMREQALRNQGTAAPHTPGRPVLPSPR